MKHEEIVLFGAGDAGRFALAHLRTQGIEPVAFADNDAAKWDSTYHGVPIYNVDDTWGRYPQARWVACAFARPAAPEIRQQIHEMKVPILPLWACTPTCHGLPPEAARDTVSSLCGDRESVFVLNDQCIFRKSPDYAGQPKPLPYPEIYFPDFIARLDDGEVFIDCGAADGDTISSFLARWPRYSRILAIEPDAENMRKLLAVHKGTRLLPLSTALGDFDGRAVFVTTGDYSAHLSTAQSRDVADGIPVTVPCHKLDSIVNTTEPPTYIKMDVEGAELEALWGARDILDKHKPVLAICAYHASSHLWQVPLLIHAIQPAYKLYLRRYAEGAREIVWYAVPPERLVSR